MRADLVLIIKKYEQHTGRIRRLWMKDTSFRALCGEYHECLVARQYWEQSDSDDAPARREEYAALLLELEEEILQWLYSSAANEG
jgi:hypothetical protein